MDGGGGKLLFSLTLFPASTPNADVANFVRVLSVEQSSNLNYQTRAQVVRMEK